MPLSIVDEGPSLSSLSKLMRKCLISFEWASATSQYTVVHVLPDRFPTSFQSFTSPRLYSGTLSIYGSSLCRIRVKEERDYERLKTWNNEKREKKLLAPKSREPSKILQRLVSFRCVCLLMLMYSLIKHRGGRGGYGNHISLGSFSFYMPWWIPVWPFPFFLFISWYVLTSSFLTAPQCLLYITA